MAHCVCLNGCYCNSLSDFSGIFSSLLQRYRKRCTEKKKIWCETGKVKQIYCLSWYIQWCLYQNYCPSLGCLCVYRSVFCWPNLQGANELSRLLEYRFSTMCQEPWCQWFNSTCQSSRQCEPECSSRKRCCNVGMLTDQADVLCWQNKVYHKHPGMLTRLLNHIFLVIVWSWRAYLSCQSKIC